MMDDRWLLDRPGLHSRAQVLARPSPVPACPGIYAWFFRELPHPDINVSRCIAVDALTLLYVGISPAREASGQNLRTRITTHFDGNAYGSTLRLTLGALLADRLNLIAVARGNRGKIHFGSGEATLSDWMAQNAFVAWTVREHPWEVEEQLIASLDLPLNIDMNRNHPFCPVLKEARRRVQARVYDPTIEMASQVLTPRRSGGPMRGRTAFSRSEIDQLKRLINQKNAAGRSAQKAIRQQMRDMGFYISDFERAGQAFSVSDLEDLIRAGIVRVSKD